MENTFDLKKFLVENKLTNNSRLLSENKELTPEEQKVVDDILNSVNEGMFDDMLEKVKSYAKKGLITAAVLTTLLGAPNLTQAQRQDIKDIAQTEMSATPRTKVDISKMSNKEVYDATVKAVKSMGVDRAIKFVESLPSNTKEESTDKQMVLTFLKSIKDGSPMKETEYVGKRLKAAFTITTELLYSAGNSMAFFDQGGKLR
jgi:hypothetical protein